MVDVTDDFERAALGGNWTNSLNSLTISGSSDVKGNTANDNIARWNANTFAPDHYSEVLVSTGDADGGGPAVRHQSGAATCYSWQMSAADTLQMYEITAGTFVALGAAYFLGAGSTNAGTLLRLDATGSTFTPSVDGVAQATRSDASITGGGPAIGIFATTVAFESWLGGPIVLATVSRLRTPHFGPGKRPWSKLRATKIFPAGTLAPASFTLTADVGTFAETGIAAILRLAMPVAVGTFAETGQAVTFRSALTSAKGTFTESGQAIIFREALTAAKGTFTETGLAVIFRTTLTASNGAFVLTGNAATLTATGVSSYTMPAAVGGFALSGKTAAFAIGLTAAKGTFNETGIAAAFAITMPAAKGIFILTGQPANLTATGQGGGGAAANQNFPFIANVGTLMGR